MDAAKSKILCPINPLFIRNTFSIPVKFSQVSKDFNEESIIHYFRGSTVEQKRDFFNICFKPHIQLQNHPFHVDSSLFNKETQRIITLISQFLGLDTYKYVTETLMSMLFTFNTSQIES